MYTHAEKRQVAVRFLEIVIKEGIVQLLKEKGMKNTTRIYDFIAKADKPITIKEIQKELNMLPGIASGSLACLLSSNKLTREKIDKLDGTKGPKKQWAYKIVLLSE